MKDLYEQIYEKMCLNCPNAKYCHERCDECYEFQKELERKEENEH